MNKYAVASLLMLPAFAPPLAAQTLLVEYEGIVSQVENPQFAPDLNYAVGDRVKGTLEMDAAPEGGPITDDDLRQSFEAIPEKDGRCSRA